MGALLLACLCLLPSACKRKADETTIHIYSSRIESLIRPVTDRYTEKTGVQVQILTDKEGPLIERIRAEGTSTPADLLITVDAGNLWYAAKEGLLAPLSSSVLEERIPAPLRDPEGRWFGLSLRVRTIVYNKKKHQPADFSTYEDLAGPRWKGKLCLRSSKKVYNQSLAAMLLHAHGPQKAEQILKGWVANLALPVFPDDTVLLKAIASGSCDVGIVNSYYLGRLLQEEPELPLGIFWADQNAGGVHVNISGAGVTAHSRNKQGAQDLLEYLASDEAQEIFARLNLEYPVLKGVSVAPEIKAWGEFKSSPMPLIKAGELQREAIQLMDRVGYR